MIGGPTEKEVPLLAALHSSCIVRGVVAGTRQQLKHFVKFVEEEGLKPALDDMVFKMEEVKGAYLRQERQEHFSKVVIKLQA